MQIIGLTGGIGSGKSTVTRYFSELGVPIIDTDTIAHQLVAKGMPALEQLKSAFGETILTEAGDLNRAYMRQLVFSSNNIENSHKKRLESILHPLIYQKVQLDIKDLQDQKSPIPYCIVVIPLLVETWPLFEDLLDDIVVVDSPEDLQITRIQERNLTKEQVLAIIKSQSTRQKRLAKAQHIIKNTGNLDDLKAQVHRLDTIWRQI